MPQPLVQAIESLAAVGLIGLALRSAIGTVVVPRGIPSGLTRMIFIAVRQVFRLRLLAIPRRSRNAEDRRDRVLVYYAPAALLTLQAVWLLLVAAGFALAALAEGQSGWDAVDGSGSALLTLGFVHPGAHLPMLLAFLEAALGLALLALLITYLPSLYTAFNRREHVVRKLEVRAGDPPSGVELLERTFRGRRQSELSELWRTWEDWFTDVEETHTSFASLAFFRSTQRRHSWITAAGAVLDGAALLLALAGIDPDDPDSLDHCDAEARAGDPIEAEVALRSGTLALQRVATFYGVPQRVNGIVRVDREEFRDAFARLELDGISTRRDEEAAWTRFRVMRSRYDDALVGLAALVDAPAAMWSSDRVGLRADPPGRGRLRFSFNHVSDDESAGISRLDPPALLMSDSHTAGPRTSGSSAAEARAATSQTAASPTAESHRPRDRQSSEP